MSQVSNADAPLPTPRRGIGRLSSGDADGQTSASTPRATPKPQASPDFGEIDFAARDPSTIAKCFPVPNAAVASRLVELLLPPDAQPTATDAA